MYQLFAKSHGLLFRLRFLLRNQYQKIPKSLSPHSHFRFSQKAQISDAKLDFVLKEVEQLQSLKPLIEEEQEEIVVREKAPIQSTESKIEISHPWPEWVELMERLLKKGYLDRDGVGSKDSNRIRTACLNFARDRFDLVRYLSRKHIQVIVGSGCPSLDRKVVNSGKRLRAHMGIEEGNVCSSCNLRGSCERAYIKAREDEGGRTVDVMRILLTYGLEPITGLVENKPCLIKTIKESVRKLMKEMVEFSARELDSDLLKETSKRLMFNKSDHLNRQQMAKVQTEVPMKQGDWICPKCKFLNFAKNNKCLRCDGVSQERLKKLGEDQDHLPMKRGDWLCDKCNFLNFAKNTKCLQCDEKPPKRQLNPGEWECVSCNYINFRRNMVCLKCDWKRPKASNCEDSSAQFHRKDQECHHRSRILFVRNDAEANDLSNGQNLKDDADFWSCGEDGGAKDGLSPWSDFKDFPIVGGKSAVSQNPQARERWKGKMTRRSRSDSRVKRKANDGDLGSMNLHRRLEFDESSDEDEMAGWFGYEKRIGD